LDARSSESAERLFRWLRLNQWISIKDVGWLPLTLWDESSSGDRGEMRTALKGQVCYLGLDLSSTTDLTALTAIFPPENGRAWWSALFWCWIPRDTMLEAEKKDRVPYSMWADRGEITATEGGAVDYTAVHEVISRLRKEYRVQGLGVDPWNSRMLTQELMAEGLEVVEIPQTIAGMSPAMKDLELLLRKQQMIHEPSPPGRWCFGNVRCATDGNENLKPMKNRSRGRIDITVSWIIAVAMARTKMDVTKISVYEQRGPRMLEL
jgi:phage terminase large subunit-like protein